MSIRLAFAQCEDEIGIPNEINLSNYAENNDFSSILQAIVGIFIGSMMTYLITMKRMQTQARITYLSTILQDKDIRTSLGSLIQRLEIKQKNDTTIMEIESQLDKSWFFLLFTPSKKKYEELKLHIERKEWEESLKTISEFLRGIW